MIDHQSKSDPIDPRLLQEIGTAHDRSCTIEPGEAASLKLPKEFAPIIEEYECLTWFGKWWRKRTCKHPGPVLEMRFQNDQGTLLHTHYCLRCREQWGDDQMQFEAGKFETVKFEAGKETA